MTHTHAPQDLYREHQASSAERLQALANRQHQLTSAECLVKQLDEAVPFNQLLDPEPQDYPKPAPGSERWVGAPHYIVMPLGGSQQCLV